MQRLSSDSHTGPTRLNQLQGALHNGGHRVAERVTQANRVQIDLYPTRNAQGVSDSDWLTNDQRSRRALRDLGPSSKIGQLWSRRTPRQKRLIAIGALASVIAVATSIGVAVGLTRPKPHGTVPGAFNDTFAGLIAADWAITDGRANGASYRCGFTNQAVSTNASGTALSVIAGNYSARPYGCGQLQHVDTFLFGNFSASMQVARGLGVVTALFTYTETEANINQEIDIEFTGLDTTTMYATSWRDGKNTTKAIPLGFDAADGPHIYGFSWRDDMIAWQVDEQEVYRLTESASLPAGVPTDLFVSTWLSAPNSWVGEYDPTTQHAPASSGLRWLSFAV